MVCLEKQDNKNRQEEDKMFGKSSKKSLVVGTKWILDFMMASGVIVLLTSPFLLKYAGEHYAGIIQEHYLLYVVVYLISGVMGLTIIFCLRKMMKTVIRQNCFVDENVRELRIMGIASLAIAVAFLIKEIFAWTVAGVIIVLVFFIAALFSLVLAGVFEEAVRYKKENDLTI